MKINKLTIIAALLTTNSAFAQQFEKTSWGEIPISISAKLDEITNGQVAAITIETKCNQKPLESIEREITRKGHQRIEDNVGEKHKYIALKYSEDSLTQKKKVFNAIYKEKSCTEIPGLYVLAKETQFLVTENKD